MPIVGKKLEPAVLSDLRSTLAQFRAEGLPSPHAEALLDHADWLQAELDRHIRVAQAKPDSAGIAVEMVCEPKSAVGWTVVTTDPKGDAKREVTMALETINLLAVQYQWFDLRERMRVVFASIVRSLETVGEATPDRILATLDRQNGIDAAASEAKKRGRAWREAEALRGENEALRCVVAEQEALLQGACGYAFETGRGAA